MGREFQFKDFVQIESDLDQMISDKEPLEDNPKSDTIKLLFLRLFQYDPYFREIMSKFISLFVAASAHRDYDMLLPVLENTLQKLGDWMIPIMRNGEPDDDGGE